MPNIDDSRTKEVLFDAGFADSRVPQEQLFDLIFDPNEANNLAESAQHITILGEMRERLKNWMEKTDDPILKGPVSDTDAQEATNVDAYSPGGRDQTPLVTWPN